MAQLPRANVWDTLTLFTDVVAPTLGKGVTIRRPRVVALAEAVGLDARAVKRVQALRRKYGRGPVMMAVPRRRQAIILAPEHVTQVLDGAPEPFSPATFEKRSALAHFQPKNSLISTPPEREPRRRFSEKVLEFRCPVHSRSDIFLDVIREEAQALLEKVQGELGWAEFFKCWYRVVRRIVLGNGAAHDHELTDMLEKLRSAGNWGFLHPGRPRLRKKYQEKLARHIERAESGSLVEVISQMPNHRDVPALDQVSQYLFAFDPGGMATFRTLALLATHGHLAALARDEIMDSDWKNLPYVRACLLDCLRLWPTTPAILRETTQEVEFDTGVMPKSTHVFIFAPFFHRDEERLPYAHRFEPGIWLDEQPGAGWPLVPFSHGPAACPARDFVPMIASAMIANIMSRRKLALPNPDRLDPLKDMPAKLNNYSMKLLLRPV